MEKVLVQSETWGSPMIIFKSNGITYDFKKFSVRAIVPPVQNNLDDLLNRDITNTRSLKE